MYDIKTNKSGLVLIELLTIITILIVLTAIAIPAFHTFYKETDLTNSHQELINILITAQNRTLASEQESQWGVYFSTSTTPHQYVLFKGADYTSRDSLYDETYSLPDRVEFSQVDLGSQNEVIFNRVSGDTSQSGEIELRLIENILKTKWVTVKNSGQTTSGQEPVPSDLERVKDSRHTHFTYTRQIATATDILRVILIHDDGSITTQDVVLADNMIMGQIYWQGEILVDGEAQILKIHTHRLNDLEGLYERIRLWNST